MYTLVSRRTVLKFHGRPEVGKARSWWQKIQRPQTGIGPGWRLRFCADAPMLFHHLPESLRLEAVRRILGPSGGWFTKDKVVGKVPLLLGCTTCSAPRSRTAACGFSFVAADGSEREVLTEHVIAATGYKVDLDRLKFLSAEIRSKLKVVNGAPVLSSSFESSMPGLYFAGITAANSFGPVMRFAFGAGFAARTITRAVAKSVARKPAAVSGSSRHELHEVKVPEAREKAGAASQGS